jgi:hypothetical protein
MVIGFAKRWTQCRMLHALKSCSLKAATPSVPLLASSSNATNTGNFVGPAMPAHSLDLITSVPREMMSLHCKQLASGCQSDQCRILSSAIKEQQPA